MAREMDNKIGATRVNVAQDGWRLGGGQVSGVSETMANKHKTTTLLAFLSISLALNLDVASANFLGSGKDIACVEGQPIDLIKHFPMSGDQIHSNCARLRNMFVTCSCKDGLIKCGFTNDCSSLSPIPSSSIPSSPIATPSKHQKVIPIIRTHPSDLTAGKRSQKTKLTHRSESTGSKATLSAASASGSSIKLPKSLLDTYTRSSSSSTSEPPTTTASPPANEKIVLIGNTYFHLPEPSGSQLKGLSRKTLEEAAEVMGMSPDKYAEKLRMLMQMASDRTASVTMPTTTMKPFTTTTTELPTTTTEMPTTTTIYEDPLLSTNNPVFENPPNDIEGFDTQPSDPAPSKTSADVDQVVSKNTVLYLVLGAELLVLGIIIGLCGIRGQTRRKEEDRLAHRSQIQALA